jgi:pilus assembly protein Flp/PilA
MQLKLWMLYSRMQRLIVREEGQDLIEYALVVALLAFAAVASMQTLAGDINTVYVNIGTTLTSDTP